MTSNRQQFIAAIQDIDAPGLNQLALIIFKLHAGHILDGQGRVNPAQLERDVKQMLPAEIQAEFFAWRQAEVTRRSLKVLPGVAPDQPAAPARPALRVVK